eukprot:Nitzschia sp. Nitz4//scaffold48_size128905//108531//110093//NITZ4_003618-RA/size128905-processed-gene-0.226-mRNA-1//1//CDS//3329553036//6164//frame0
MAGYMLAGYLIQSWDEPSSLKLGETDQARTHQEGLGKLQQGPPIDNYFSRPHIRQAVPLIVGGSDGSGTRSFATILEKLGVPMLVEDRGTMDVHAKQILNGAGWPALVSTVLNATRSAAYPLTDMPVELSEMANTEIEKFLKVVEMTGAALTGISNPNNVSWATDVTWGFKAPVSMLLLPFFRHQLPAFKFLHVIRDGRDVALSDNHSPVHKFYHSYYPDAQQRHNEIVRDPAVGQEPCLHIKAMQLWNDWNVQVYRYGERYTDGQTFDVLVMRTEDLLQRPLESVTLLADFVGSRLTSKELCCLSQSTATDLGQSAHSPMDSPFHKSEQGNMNTGGLGAHMVDPNSFGNIRKRFQEMAQKDAEPVTHRGDKKDNEDGEDLESPDESHRRLTTQDPPSIFKTGGRVASGNWSQGIGVDSQPIRLDKGVQAENQPNSMFRVQQLMKERRGQGAQPSKPQTPEEVAMRYGKWTRVLEGDPLLSKHLHSEGQEGLALFGYNPPRAFLDVTSTRTLTCSTTSCY